MTDKPGRNSPCPCGSGKKYKRCCYGKILPDVDQSNQFDVETAVDEALSLFTSGSQREGKIMIEKSLKDFPNSPYPHFARGTMRAIKENYNAAINDFDEAIRMDPNYIEAYFNKGMAYKGLFDVKNCIKSFQEVVKRGQSDNETVHNARKFLNDMEESIQKDHQVDLATYMAGYEIFDEAFSLMENREWKKAMNGFKKCLEKNKNHHQCYGNIGICLAMLGRKSESLKALNTALSMDPTYKPAIINRSLVENLKEGEKPQEEEFFSIDYSKEEFLQNRLG